MADAPTVVTIASRLDAALVTRIAAVDDRLQVGSGRLHGTGRTT